jgi:hypothetical protein
VRAESFGFLESVHSAPAISPLRQRLIDVFLRREPTGPIVISSSTA